MEKFPARIREELALPYSKNNKIPLRASEIPEFKTKSSMKHPSQVDTAAESGIVRKRVGDE